MLTHNISPASHGDLTLLFQVTSRGEETEAHRAEMTCLLPQASHLLIKIFNGLRMVYVVRDI